MLKSILRPFVTMGSVVFATGLVFYLVGCRECQTGGALKISLADNSRALHNVVVSDEASERTREAAKDLAKYLSVITGGEFIIKEGDGAEGIAVGSYEDFPKLRFKSHFDPNDPTRRDEYILRTHSKGIYLIGATDLAAQHAVWDILYRIGYRQFFPTETWEIVPEEPNLSIEVEAYERPDFYNRNGPRVAPYSDNKLWRRWHDRNRITSSFVVNTGHSYNGIIDRNKAAFNENPEFLALADGKRGGGRGDKFCISNENLRRLVVEDAKHRVEENPDVISISMDPSDGGSYCECEACAEMGSISDQVIILANEVAEAINNMGYGKRYVGIYAYGNYSPPPNIDVHPKVIVSIATAFLRGGYTLEELIEGWSKRTKMIGIREYYDLFVWQQSQPRKAPGGNVRYLMEKIPYYYERGARFMNAESSDSWASSGLGYYISSHLLWNIDAVDKVEDLINDFLTKSFGEAHEPMRKFYHLIAVDHDSPHTEEDILAHMYGFINEARGLTTDPKVLARLNELAMYTRYIELWFRLNGADKDDVREKAAQDVFRHAYRMQNTMMVQPGSLYRYLRRIKISIPAEADPGDLLIGKTLEDMEPWKSSKSFTDHEIVNIIENGIATYKKDVIEFEIVSFSENLEPAALKLNLRKVSTGNMGGNNSFRGRHKMFTWFSPENNQLTMEVTGGLIKSYRDRGNVRFMLFSPQEVTLDPVDTDESVPPDGDTYKIALKSPYTGLHELQWSDGSDMTRVEWPEGQPMTVRASMEDPARLEKNSRLYFYVPKGTKTVGGHTTHNDIQILDSEANIILDLHNVPGGEGYFNISVPKGQDGTLWTLQCSNSTVRLLTVPPYLARNEKELLLPAEVIEADKSER